MIVCIGPCCVPLHLVLAFLVATLHRWGYMTWFKEEWVTFKYWRQRWFGSPQRKGVEAAGAARGRGSAAPPRAAERKKISIHPRGPSGPSAGGATAVSFFAELINPRRELHDGGLSRLAKPPPPPNCSPWPLPRAVGVPRGAELLQPGRRGPHVPRQAQEEVHERDLDAAGGHHAA
eukprot:CAMPEP_0119123566 /NCGR_PEP_ID=MMETSP1310-20130426/3476_1 /TAXON_ID=464262 /ORGANISM="Genus nov. species nov., Strain RCC2339" /LENGTH=175 /DNA_ID=CAMNT_0007113409 /DNA_START=15 /DNA_END=540 /DNA_ORIENTATION=-